MRSGDYRALARQVLRGKWLKLYGLMMIIYLFSMKFFLSDIWETFFSRSIPFLDKPRLVPAGFGWVLAGLALVMSAVNYSVTIGRYAASKTLLAGRTPGLKRFFPMKYFFKALVMNIVMGILLVLQLFLLIVPGVIAIIAYSMAPYLLLENPDLGPVQALKESRRRMKGHKWEWVCLNFSFIGWMLIPMVLSYLAGRIGAGISVSAAVFLPIVVCMLAWPLPSLYMDVAHAAFFHDVLHGIPQNKK